MTSNRQLSPVMPLPDHLLRINFDIKQGVVAVTLSLTTTEAMAGDGKPPADSRLETHRDWAVRLDIQRDVVPVQVQRDTLVRLPVQRYRVALDYPHQLVWLYDLTLLDAHIEHLLRRLRECER